MVSPGTEEFCRTQSFHANPGKALGKLGWGGYPSGAEGLWLPPVATKISVPVMHVSLNRRFVKRIKLGNILVSMQLYSSRLCLRKCTDSYLERSSYLLQLSAQHISLDMIVCPWKTQRSYLKNNKGKGKRGTLTENGADISDLNWEWEGETWVEQKYFLLPL